MYNNYCMLQKSKTNASHVPTSMRLRTLPANKVKCYMCEYFGMFQHIPNGEKFSSHSWLTLFYVYFYLRAYETGSKNMIRVHQWLTVMKPKSGLYTTKQGDFEQKAHLHC